MGIHSLHLDFALFGYEIRRRNWMTWIRLWLPSEKLVTSTWRSRRVESLLHRRGWDQRCRDMGDVFDQMDG